MSQPRALITGITGQDGAYLARRLVDEGYEVFGVLRPQSLRWRLEQLGLLPRVNFLETDLARFDEIRQMLTRVRPAEVYHLAALSSVAESYLHPLVSGQGDAMVTLSLLEGIRTVSPESRFFLASSSEMFGLNAPSPQSEETRLAPCSPYACAKVYGHHLVATYRESYGIFACSGIMFNHESPLRGIQFVTRKITSNLVRIKTEGGEALRLGNLDSRRDWGYAEEYTDAMHRMLSAERPEDFVLATGRAYSVREFCEFAAHACSFDLDWRKEDGREIGVDRQSGQILIQSTTDLQRTHDIPLLVGNPDKASRELGWCAKIRAPELASIMVEAEFRRTATQKL